MLVRMLVLFLIVFISASGCVSAGDGASITDQSTALKQTAETWIGLFGELGIEFDLIADVSAKGYAGAFTGAIWDLGPSMKIHAKLSPDEAKRLQALLAARTSTGE